MNTFLLISSIALWLATKEMNMLMLTDAHRCR
jgi:hypothetical protein